MNELVKKVSPVLGNGFTAAARIMLWQHEQWRLEAPIGIMRWDYEIDSQLGNTVLTSRDNGTDWFYGLQLNYQLVDNWQVGVSAQQLQLQPNDVNNWQLHLRYQF